MRSDIWSMSLALSFLALAAVTDPTEAFTRRLEVPVAGRFSSSSWETTATTRSMLDLRGGGLFGGKKSTARIYRESLEEQVLLLNEQLADARIEVTKLRDSAKKRHNAGSRLLRVKVTEGASKEEEKAMQAYAKHQESLQKEREREQKKALARLQDEIKQLEKMKAELEKLLETSAQKIEALEEQLAEQDSLTAKMEASYKEKIAQLEQKLADIQTSQLEKLAEINQQKVDAAVQEALRVQEAEFRAKIEETTLRLTKEHARAMEQEKLRSSKAVETERKKMRKLVRALAMREKKLKLHGSGASDTKADREESIEKKAVTTSTSSKKKKKPFTAPTARGTI